MTRKSISKKVRFEVFKRDFFTCQYCGNTPPKVVLELDHVTPVAKGGDGSMDNLLCSCFDCNRGKASGLLTSIPNTLIQKADVIKEKKEQLAAYERLLSSARRKQRKDSLKIQSIFQEKFEDSCFTDHFFTSIKDFLEKLPRPVLEDAMERACAKINDPSEAIKYFCGIAWNKIRDTEDAQVT